VAAPWSLRHLSAALPHLQHGGERRVSLDAPRQDAASARRPWEVQLKNIGERRRE
jgi:hypothetical protein